MSGSDGCHEKRQGEGTASEVGRCSVSGRHGSYLFGSDTWVGTKRRDGNSHEKTLSQRVWSGGEHGKSEALREGRTCYCRLGIFEQQEGRTVQS